MSGGLENGLLKQRDIDRSLMVWEKLQGAEKEHCRLSCEVVVVEEGNRCLRKGLDPYVVAVRESETANARDRGLDQQAMAAEKAATDVFLVLLD